MDGVRQIPGGGGGGKVSFAYTGHTIKSVENTGKHLRKRSRSREMIHVCSFSVL